MPSPKHQRRGLDPTARFAFRRAKSQISASSSTSSSSTSSSLSPSLAHFPNSASASRRIVGSSSAPSSPRSSPQNSFSDIPYLSDAQNSFSDIPYLSDAKNSFSDIPSLSDDIPNLSPHHPMTRNLDDSLIERSSATSGAVNLSNKLSSSSSSSSPHSSSSYSCVPTRTVSNKKSVSFSYTATTPTILRYFPTKIVPSSSSSSSSPSSRNASTFYNSSFANDFDWSKKLLESPFDPEAPSSAEIEDDGDDDDFDDNDDDDVEMTMMPFGNKLFKIVSGFLILFIVVVILVSATGGVSDFLLVTPASDSMESVLVEKLVEEKTRTKTRPFYKGTKMISNPKTDGQLELTKRMRIEKKLENSVVKRNRILDILLRQQNQQTIILERQKEILLILNKAKKR